MLGVGNGAWTAPTLEGELVRLEPLTPAARGRALGGLPRPAHVAVAQRRAAADAGGDARLPRRRAREPGGSGLELRSRRCAASDDRVVGSTRYLALRPEHRSVEIGWTWLTPEAWGTGANVEAKLLMLEHAFERLGCLRVELKTDARNERSRGAMAALPAQFEGVHRSPCSSAAASGATRPGTA